MSTNDPHNLSAVNDLDQLVSRIPNGAPLIRMLRQLGFWVGHGQPAQSDAPVFPTNLASLSDEQLGNANGFWQSEMSRATEIAGALDATRIHAKAAVTRARAQALNDIVSTLDDGQKLPTKALLDAKIATVPEVVTAEDSLALLESVLAAFKGIREGLEGRCKVLSREITRRGDLKFVGRGVA